jgi:hypothetical protein
MPKIQVTVDRNIHGILTQMKDAGLRGGTVSQIAYTILDEWIWHNNSQLKDRGINLRVSVGKRIKK